MAGRKLTRHETRYWCFRFRTEETEGVPATGAPSGLRKRFEEHPHFAGWDKFGMTWDIGADGATVVPLRHTLEQTWNAEALSSARELPRKE